MIKAPTSIRFFVPSAIENLDQTAEPTLEGITGEDYLGNVISSGGQVVNAADGQARRAFQADTDTSSSTWRVDTELEQRGDISFVMVDQHNLRNAYPAATKEQISQYYYTADTFGSATEATPEREVSGLIGRERPSMEFLGNSEYAATASSIQNAIAQGEDKTVELWIEMQDDYASGDVLLGSVTNGSWAIRTTANNSIYFAVRNTGGTNTLFNATSKIQCSPESVCHVVFVATWNDTALTITPYIDGVQGTAETKTVSGEYDTAHSIQLWTSSAGLVSDVAGRIYGARVFNRALSSSEVSSLYGDSPLSTADEWGSRTDLLDSGQATSIFGGSTEGNSAASWTGVAATTSSVTSAEGFSPRRGTYMLKAVSADVNAHAYQAITTVSGETYRVYGWLREPDTTQPLTLRAGTTAGDNDLAESSAVSTADSWEYKAIEFTATGATTYISVYKANTGPVTFYADAVYAYRSGCVSEYHSSGINRGDGIWYDSSTNNLNATISGGKYVDVPNGQDDFYLATFPEVSRKYWFTNFNEAGETGVTGVDTLVGQVVLGEVYNFEHALVVSAGHSGVYQHPGVRVQMTEGGVTISERYYDERPRWTLDFQRTTTAEFEKFLRMMDVIQDGLYPFYVCFDWTDISGSGELNAVIHRVRLDTSASWGYDYSAPDRPWIPTITLVAD